MTAKERKRRIRTLERRKRLTKADADELVRLKREIEEEQRAALQWIHRFLERV